MTLHLVRHGPSVVDVSEPAASWTLDKAGWPDIVKLARRLPSGALFFSSPEPKAVETAKLLTREPVEVVDDLRQQERLVPGWIDDMVGTVVRAFLRPDVSAYDGWEPIAMTRKRVAGAVRSILRLHPFGDVVLVGHATVWTLIVAELTAAEPDPELWAAIGMPDVIELRREQTLPWLRRGGDSEQGPS